MKRAYFEVIGKRSPCLGINWPDPYDNARFTYELGKIHPGPSGCYRGFTIILSTDDNIDYATCHLVWESYFELNIGDKIFITGKD